MSITEITSFQNIDPVSPKEPTGIDLMKGLVWTIAGLAPPLILLGATFGATAVFLARPKESFEKRLLSVIEDGIVPGALTGVFFAVNAPIALFSVTVIPRALYRFSVASLQNAKGCFFPEK